MRDVFLALRPGTFLFKQFLGLRGRAARDALVLVPTSATLRSHELSTRGHDALVEIVLLEDALDVRAGALVRRASQERLRAPQGDAPAEDDAAATPAGGVDAGPGAPRGKNPWADVTFYLVDHHTLRVDVGDRIARRTYVDMGMAHATTREPVKAWELLVALCEGSGTFNPRAFGSYGNARQVVSRLRKALCRAMNIDADPIEEYTADRGWHARFRAMPSVPRGFRAR